MSAHAILSPSSASRWIACTPSARLEAELPEVSSGFADEGTLAHKLAELLGRYRLKRIKKPEYNRELKVIEADKNYAPEMFGYVEGFVENWLELYAKAKKIDPMAEVYLEHRLDLSEYVPEGFGTGDVIIVSNGIVYLRDLKYGKGVKVSVVDNAQLKLYSLGICDEFIYAYDFHLIDAGIYQPRIDNVSETIFDVGGLVAWANEILRPRAEMAIRGEGDFRPGDHCKFCKIRATCRANSEYQLELAAHEFKDVVFLGDDEILDIVARAPAFYSWLKAVEEHVYSTALAGKAWDGYKLVEGRSNRVYADEPAIRKALEDLKIEEEKYTKTKLIGITDMQKLLGKKTFDEIIGKYVVKPPGKPTLVTVDDPRGAMGIDQAIADFKDVPTDE